MQSDNPSKTYAETLQRAIFHSIFTPLYDYLDTIATFLEKERRSHEQGIADINQKIELGQIEPPDDPTQMPPELEYDYFRLDFIADFEDRLFDSFFVMIYSDLESKLLQYCHDLQEKNHAVLSASDMKGNPLEQAKTYLEKYLQMKFLFVKNREWDEIQKIRRVRNSIVHNQGVLKISNQDDLNKFEKFISESKPKPDPENIYHVTLNKEICEKSLDIIETFLYTVISAKPSSI